MIDINKATSVAAKPTSKHPRKMGRELKTESSVQLTPDTAPAKRKSKAGVVLDLLQRNEGATIDQLVAATSWLPHTCRAFLTSLRKKGWALERSKRDDGTTIYQLAPSIASV